MNRFDTGFPELERIIDDDLSELLSQIDKKWSLDIRLVDLDIYDLGFDDDEECNNYYVTPSFTCEDEEFSISFHVLEPADPLEEYFFDDVTMLDIYDAYMYRYYMSMNQPYDAEDFWNRIKRRGNVSIESSTAIMAADEDDPFNDMGFEDEDETSPIDDEDSVSNNIDDMADTLDEINDALKDFDEDDIDIETENNISDHFIAECEKCHGVFITAIVESDQEIEKISGTCPLCDEECDQYLKWIIRDL